MRILISGICGFVGSEIALHLTKLLGAEIVGIDNLSRPGSWSNRGPLADAGIQVVHGDVRQVSDIESCGAIDWVIDAAANPSVLAGTTHGSSSRQVVETNLLGTLNLLEHCKKHAAGFIFLSSSRVYSIETLSSLPVQPVNGAFTLPLNVELPFGVKATGITESCPTSSPVSLYGATKLSSEALALEYHHAFGFPVWVNRCGVMAGAGQFGKADQGIFAYWLHSWRDHRPLTLIGFDGTGHQTRDCLHPRDLANLLAKQIKEPEESAKPRTVNVSGGSASAMSLAQLSRWCENRWGPRDVGVFPDRRPYDLPWIVLDPGLASQTWGWRPSLSADEVLEDIANFADSHPNFPQSFVRT
jgi:CDP-paratose 2-epimerase